MEHAGQMLSKQQLPESVWHYDFGGGDSIFASYISYLRREVDVHEPELIHTVRTTGYVLRRPRSERPRGTRDPGPLAAGRLLVITVLLLVAALFGSTGLAVDQLRRGAAARVAAPRRRRGRPPCAWPFGQVPAAARSAARCQTAAARSGILSWRTL
ncbi:winged helix-turn-helix domain-containing protein [Streptomyces sp. NPDC002996]